MIRHYGIPASIYPATLVVVCAVAVWRGGRYERVAAFGLLGAWALTFVVYRIPGIEMQVGLLAVDLTLLALLIWVAMRSSAYWPIFAAGFHLLAILTHLAKGLDRELGVWVYLSAEIIWGYLLAFAIGIGSWRHRAIQLATNTDPTPDPGATFR